MWRYYQANLARAAQDLPTLPEHIHRVTAAYMTLGSFGHREVVPRYLEQAFGVTVDPDNYELSGGAIGSTSPSCHLEGLILVLTRPVTPSTYEADSW